MLGTNLNQNFASLNSIFAILHRIPDPKCLDIFVSLFLIQRQHMRHRFILFMESMRSVNGETWFFMVASLVKLLKFNYNINNKFNIISQVEFKKDSMYTNFIATL